MLGSFLTKICAVFFGALFIFLGGFSNLALACEDPDYSFPESIKGTWSGFLHMEEEAWSIEFHFAQNPENGCFDVRGSFPESGDFFYPPENYSKNQNSIAFDVHGIPWNIAFTYDHENEKITGTWTRPRNDLTLPFTLTKTSEQAPFFRQEEITFQSPDGARLVGTLILPPGEGPFPAIVWTHGSGKQTRDTSFYASRAHLSASLGLASFIYDKRGNGESTGDNYESLENMFMDAASAVEAVRKNLNVKSNQVGIGGASQGGWIAPQVAGSDENIAFVIAGSAPGITPAEQNIFSMVGPMESELGPEITAMAESALRQVYEYYRTGEGFDELQSLLTSEEAQVWAQHEMFLGMLPNEEGPIPEKIDLDGDKTMYFDPLPFWEKITVPVFAVWGSTDHNLPAYKSQELIEQALMKNGNANVISLVLPGAGHGIELRKPNYGSYEGRANEGKYYFFRMHPNYIPALTAFIKDRLQE